MKNCDICKQNAAKYRCPKCRIPYCSVACCKLHKETPCSPTEEVSEKFQAENYVIDKTETQHQPNVDDDCYIIPEDKLRKLGENIEIRDSLNNGDLRRILTWIHSNSNPERAIKIAMNEPIFVEYVDKCLEVIEPSDIKKSEVFNVEKLEEYFTSNV